VRCMKDLSMLQHASRGKTKNVLKMLSEGMVHVDGFGTRKWDCKSALYEACRAGHLRVVQALIRAGADVNLLSTPDKDTALHAACTFGRSVEVVEALLNAGANVDIRNKYGATALLLILDPEGTYIRNKVEIARLLLNAKCDVNVEVDGSSALIYACEGGISSDILRLIIASNADLTKRNRADMTALHVLIANKAPIDLIKILLENGVDVNAKSGFGAWTPLHIAALTEQIEVIRLLFENNGDVLMQDNRKRIILMDVMRVHYHSRRENLPLVQLVLAKVNDMNPTYINLQDDYGWTALHHATAWGRRNSIKELLCWKPDLTCKTFDGGHTALHSLFLEKNDRPSEEKLDTLRCLMEHENGYRSDEVNIQDTGGRTVLHVALERSKGDDLAVLEYLSSVVDVSIANERGASALHTALYCGASQAVISALLGSTHGAVAANMRNGKGRTALHHAMVRKKMDAAVAIARITELNVADNQGRTALHHAVLLDESGFLEFLLHEREANPFLRDHRGHTPLALACKRDTCDRNSQLSSIYALLQYGVAYGKLQNMV